MKNSMTDLVRKGNRFARLLNREKMLVALLREVREEQHEMMNSAETTEELEIYSDLMERM